ncbi:MAG: tRNA pseudouridine(38-40) synthase TruA [Bacteroidales bacterium]|nr:tRNA pseudouridine(38-40) synthase TruA [Bacteroidales bacterium]
MGRYFIHLAYNGACYNGWQTQPGLPTVQQTLETALTTLLRQPVAVVGCGRTDTGVHASDFYAHFDVRVDSGECVVGSSREQVLPTAHYPLSTDLVFKLNNLLPTDIVVYDIFPVAANAHARYDAVARTYQYHVSDRRLPFRQGLYCRIYYRPDLEKMNEAARVLMEYDDFTSFAKLHTQVKTNICHLSRADWAEEEGGWVFTIRSNRFLRNMVRSVTGTLLDVGRGKLTLDGLREIIEKKDRCAAGVSMPACGLFLTKVEYPGGGLRFKV